MIRANADKEYETPFNFVSREEATHVANAALNVRTEEIIHYRVR